MDLLNKLAGQMAELFGSMTPGARVAAAIAAIAAIIGSGYVITHQVATSDVYLMSGESFSPSQLRQMQAALGQAGLEAQVDGGRVRVPRGQESKYMAALAEGHALPIDFGGYLNKALGSGSLMPMFRGQQDAALRAAKQQELRLIIENMRGIAKAAVQIDQTRSNDFPRDKDIVTAAVMVELHGGQPLSDRTARAIRHVVSSSVAGLKAESITVVDWNNHRTIPGGAESIGGSLDELADYKERQELDWQQKIAHVLEFIPGVLVSTNVELESAAASSGTPAQQAVPSSLKPSTPYARSIRRVHVSVVVPHTYYEAVWRREHPTPHGKRPYVPESAQLIEVESREKRKIETLVVNLLPGQGDRSGVGGQVAVSTFHASQPPSDPTWSELASVWLDQHWIALVVAGLVMIGLMTLHSTFTSSPASLTSSDQGQAATTALFSAIRADQAEQLAEPNMPVRPAHRPPAPVHDLADVVREDPEAAAGILRTWIGNAS